MNIRRWTLSLTQSSIELLEYQVVSLATYANIKLHWNQLFIKSDVECYSCDAHGVPYKIVLKLGHGFRR